MYKNVTKKPSVFIFQFNFAFTWMDNSNISIFFFKNVFCSASYFKTCTKINSIISVIVMLKKGGGNITLLQCWLSIEWSGSKTLSQSILRQDRVKILQNRDLWKVIKIGLHTRPMLSTTTNTCNYAGNLWSLTLHSGFKWLTGEMSLAKKKKKRSLMTKTKHLLVKFDLPLPPNWQYVKLILEKSQSVNLGTVKLF